MKHYYALFSGGLDSALAVLKIARQKKNVRITPLFFDYGQKAAKEEWEAAAKLIPLLRDFGRQNKVLLEDCRKYKVGGTGLFEWSGSSILSGREKSGQPDLENRNMVLISIATSIIMSDRKRGAAYGKKCCLVAGFKNEHYDTTRKFAQRLNHLLSQNSFGVEVVTPLVKGNTIVNSLSLAKQIQSIKGADAILTYAWSCYYPTGQGSPCGKCPPCTSRASLGFGTGRRPNMKR
jgi:7-cyano-7-deazaguanine synthase in queuosine biosynthesis